MAFDLSQYEPVEDRLAKFWSDYPTGRVKTELVAHTAGEYIVFASVFRDSEPDTLPAATGLAQEVTTGSGVNKTSALENCETSAVGRALANMGYAPKGKRPSREEMQKAKRADRTSGPVEDQWQTPEAAPLHDGRPTTFDLKAAKHELWTTAQSLGMDLAELGASFAEFSGVTLADADVMQLRAYTDALRTDGVS